MEGATQLDRGAPEFTTGPISNTPIGEGTPPGPGPDEPTTGLAQKVILKGPNELLHEWAERAHTELSSVDVWYKRAYDELRAQLNIVIDGKHPDPGADEPTIGRRLGRARLERPVGRYWQDIKVYLPYSEEKDLNKQPTDDHDNANRESGCTFSGPPSPSSPSTAWQKYSCGHAIPYECQRNHGDDVEVIGHDCRDCGWYKVFEAMETLWIAQQTTRYQLLLFLELILAIRQQLQLPKYGRLPTLFDLIDAIRQRLRLPRFGSLPIPDSTRTLPLKDPADPKLRKFNDFLKDQRCECSNLIVDHQWYTFEAIRQCIQAWVNRWGEPTPTEMNKWRAWLHKLEAEIDANPQGVFFRFGTLAQGGRDEL